MELFYQQTFLNVGYLWCLLFVMMARMFNAFVDRADHNWSENIYFIFAAFLHGFGIFKTLEQAELWFNKNQGWRNKYVNRDPAQGRVKWRMFGIRFNKPEQLCDSWHFFKTLEIICWCLAPSVIVLYGMPQLTLTAMMISFVGLGIIGNMVFSLFYNMILER